jgi:hypothetical protein
MKSRIVRYGSALAIVALSLAPAAGAPANVARIVYVPASAAPPVPAGLKVTCTNGPNSLQPAKTCPVIKYQGLTTWAFSYVDNRVSYGLVTYDANNTVVRNVEKPGARYVWNMVSSEKTQLISVFGQSNQYVEIKWSEVGP